MSMLPTYVRAVDGRFYKDPVLRPSAAGFVCFDDDDPPELVLFAGPDEVEPTAFLDDLLGPEAWTDLKPQGTMHRDANAHHVRDGRVPMDLQPARAFFFTLLQAIPVPRDSAHEGVVNGKPPGEYVYYDKPIPPIDL